MSRTFHRSLCILFLFLASSAFQPTRAQVVSEAPAPPTVDTSAEEAVMQNIARIQNVEALKEVAAEL